MSNIILPSCNYTWLDTLANTYSNNATEHNPAYLYKCCPTPETCFDQFTNCPQTVHCAIGNNAYACKIDTMLSSNSICYQDGLLATKRSLPCCPTQLTTFLANETCLEGYGTRDSSRICCTDNSTASSCEWSSLCLNYPGYSGIVGSRYGVYYSQGDPGPCVGDVTLGTQVRPGCMAESPTNTYCPAPGKAAPWGPVTTTPSSSHAHSSAPPRLAHSVQATKSIIKLAMLLIVPVVLQLLF